jgi:magnesium-transporting ATPase (P-type)
VELLEQDKIELNKKFKWVWLSIIVLLILTLTTFAFSLYIINIIIKNEIDLYNKYIAIEGQIERITKELTIKGVG